MVLLDTDVLIELFKKKKSVVTDVKNIGEQNICITKISVMEMYVGALNKRELNKIRKFLNDFSKIPVSDKVFNKTIELVYEYNLSHSLYINDALIAASALYYNIELYTLNLKDFRFINGLKLYKPK